MIWAIPILAILVGIFLAVKVINERGPTITVSFNTGDGLEPGKTHVKFKDVNIGQVKDVTLAKDRQHVLATIELSKDASDLLLDDTRFWIVRPRITATGVSGLGTLLAGPYIALDVGKSEKAKSHFVALEVAPIVTSESAGREFVLHAANLGSHDIGAPIYFRRLPVGEVVAYELDKDGQGVTLKVFVYAPYDRYVTDNSRFWNASGIDVSLSANGLQVQTESLVSIMIGGIAFESPIADTFAPIRTSTDEPIETPAAMNTQFKLYGSRGEAMKNPDVRIERYTLMFKESLRGLSVGAPVEFRGVNIGEVIRVGTEFDPQTFDFVQPVDIYLYPDRLRARSRDSKNAFPAPTTDAERLQRTKMFVERGFRAQLQTGSLITGQLYVGVDFFPGAPKAQFDPAVYPPQIPTMPGRVQEMEKTGAEVIKKFDRLLSETSALVKRLDAETVPEFNKTLADARGALKNAENIMANDSPLQTDLREALRELTRTAASLKVLTDYVERHPQSLIFGKPVEEPNP